MPVRIAFLSDGDNDEEEEAAWTAIEYFVDCVFVGDIIITFFSAYFDHEDNLVVKKRVYFNFICYPYSIQKIAWHYITGWFVLDVASVIPFHLFSDDDGSNQRLNNLIRVARLPRLYRLVKIVK